MFGSRGGAFSMSGMEEEDLGFEFEFGFKCADTDLGRKLHFESAMAIQMTELASSIEREWERERERERLKERFQI